MYTNRLGWRYACCGLIHMISTASDITLSALLALSEINYSLFPCFLSVAKVPDSGPSWHQCDLLLCKFLLGRSYLMSSHHLANHWCPCWMGPNMAVVLEKKKVDELTPKELWDLAMFPQPFWKQNNLTWNAVSNLSQISDWSKTKLEFICEELRQNINWYL